MKPSDPDAAKLLRWYPRPWRERYGEEFLAMVEDNLDGEPLRGHDDHVGRNTAALPAAVIFAVLFVPPFAVDTFLRRHGSP